MNGIKTREAIWMA